jgi:general secretion pathway protein D
VPNNTLTSPENGVSYPVITTVAPSHVKVGDVVQVIVSVNAVEELYSAPFHLIYEPNLMEFLGAEQGDFLAQDGNQTAFLEATDPRKGRIIVGLSRLGPVGGISGSGVLATFAFRAKAQGSGTLGLWGVDLRDAALEPITGRIELSEVVID